MRDWEELRRACVEGGESLESLSRRCGIPYTTLLNRAVKEDWALKESAGPGHADFARVAGKLLRLIEDGLDGDSSLALKLNGLTVQSGGGEVFVNAASVKNADELRRRVKAASGFAGTINSDPDGRSSKVSVSNTFPTSQISVTITDSVNGAVTTEYAIVSDIENTGGISNLSGTVELATQIGSIRSVGSDIIAGKGLTLSAPQGSISISSEGIMNIDGAPESTYWAGVEKLSQNMAGGSRNHLMADSLGVSSEGDQMPEFYRFYELANLNETGTEAILTDDPELFGSMKQYLSGTGGEKKGAGGSCLKEKLRLYEDKLLPMHKLYSLDRELDRALAKYVNLKSGADLVIETTEALHVIDVNSGKSRAGKLEKEEQSLKVNLEAAAECARQIRLRNLSGIILIDFINLSREEDSEKVTEALREAVAKDRIHTQVFGLTRLGLMELTRRKVELPLRKQLED